MKNLIMTAAALLCAFGISAQTVDSKKCEEISNKKYCITSKDGETTLTKDGQPMPGAVVIPAPERETPAPIIETKYCVSVEGGKAYVKNDGQILYSSVILKSGSELTPEGIVIWNDKSRTVLKDGACVNEQGVISAPATSSNDVQPREPVKTDDNAAALQQLSVTEEKTTVTVSNTNDKKDIAPEKETTGYGFGAYVQKAKEELADNETSIDAIKSKSVEANNEINIKQAKQATELGKENNALKAALQNYIANGTGDWKIFKKQFDKSLQTFQQDLHNLDYVYDSPVLVDVK